ncbi:hypothetical protein QE152_g13535 [Popillia japonica]|uniref:Uncharacterized protein n=1 Tax=Popillia japonica TaxID=7064 RepID=A0AAW1LCM5_POPJA
MYLENIRRNCKSSSGTPSVPTGTVFVKNWMQKLIRDSKRAHWNGLCEELEKDMWGRGYQIAVKKLIGYASFDLEPNQKKDIIRSLFPERRLARTERALDMEMKWFKQEELERAAQSLRSGKAPGSGR